MAKEFLAGATVVAGLSIGAVAGAGSAQADDWWLWPDPVPSPGHVGQVLNVPPGQIGQLPFVPPPGHWDKPWKWWK